MQLSIPKIPEPLIIWEKVEILTSSDANAGLYMARIEDILENGLIITQPEFIKGEILLRDKSDIILHITKADAIYCFHATIKKIKNNGRVQYHLSKPIFVQRMQRREFARVVYSTPVEYTLFNEQYSSKQKWYRSYSWDISGNGILIEAKDFVKPGSLVLLKIQLFEELNINLPVLGRSSRTILDNNTRLSGIGFIVSSEIFGYKKNYPINKVPNLAENFSLSAQEKLVAFVFNQQIEQRKKGLL